MKIHNLLLPSSIRARLTLLIVFVSIISISVVGVLSMYRTKLILTKEARDKLIFHAQLQSAVFEQDIQRVKASEQTIESMLLSRISQYAKIDSSNIQQLKKEIISQMLQWGSIAKPLSMWIVFNPQWIKGAHTISFIDKENRGVYEREKEYDISRMNLSSKQFAWWTKAVEKGDVWTEPYYWKNWNKFLISYSKAVYVNNQLVACIGSDFDFSKLKETWLNIKIYQSGYLMLLNQSNNLIIHPEKTGINVKSIISPLYFSSLQNVTTSAADGILTYTYNHKDKIMAFHRLSNGWLLMATAPFDEIFLPLEKIRDTILLLMFFAIIIAILLSYFFSQRLYAPILNLIELFDKSSKGELNHRWKYSSLIEFDRLGNQFNQFINQMQQMISQLSLQQIKLTQALKKSQESDELKSAFLGNLSHEVRTPLYAITGLASLLEKDDITREEKHNYIQIIYKNKDKLLKFVDNIMIFSKLEQKQLSPVFRQLSVNVLMSELYRNNCSQYDSPYKQIIWHTDKCDANKQLKTDHVLLLIIMDSLIDNAWKFTSKGEIHVGYQIKEHSCMFYVEDSGIGIPQLFHESIFHKFFKYNNINNDVLYEGVGMGLAIAKGLTELLEGEIKVNSISNKGARFEVWFPLVRVLKLNKV